MKEGDLEVFVLLLFAVLGVGSIVVSQAGLTGFVTTQTPEEQLYQLLQDNVDIINVNTEKIPSVFRSVFGSERANVHVSFTDGHVSILGVVTAEGKIKSIQRGALTKPTIDVFVSEQTIAELRAAGANTGTLAISALQDGRISYTAIGLVKKAKFGTASWLARFWAWFWD